MNILQKLTRTQKLPLAVEPEKRKVGYYIDTANGLYEHTVVATGPEIKEHAEIAEETVKEFHSLVNKAASNKEEFVKLGGYVGRLSDLKRIYLINCRA